MAEFKISGKLIFTGLVAVSAISCQKQPAPEPPNVVFILADDLGWKQSGAYGSDFYSTPHIDKLAAEGIRFTHAYAAAAVCSPTRAAIMTGKYPARLHLTDFIKGNPREEYPLKQPHWQMYLPLEETTLAELFKRNRYKTALFGKWHLSPEKKPPESIPYNPEKQGFDTAIVTYKPDGMTDPEGDPHNSDSIGNLSVNFIKQNAGDPFFLFVSFNAIHDPLIESGQRIREFMKNPAAGSEENHAVIGAALKRMDENIGKILQELKKEGLEEKTLVVFYSDNGGKHSYALQTPLKTGKGWLYEGGIRVPLIFRWPGVAEAGAITNQKVSAIDFFPTFADILKDSIQKQVDGISILPLLLKGKKLPERDLFWNYPHYHYGTGMKPAAALVSGDWKIIEWYEKSLQGEEGAYELFNISDDISEGNDLSDMMPEKLEEMKEKLEKMKNKTGAQKPAVRLE